MRLPKLFIFTDNKAILNKDELLFIKEFKILYDRDKGSKKIQVNKEFVFIFLLADYESPYLDYSEKDRYVKAKADSELDVLWKTDDDFKRAVAKYKELQYTPAIKSIVQLKNSFVNVSDTIEIINEQNEYLLKSCKEKLKDFKSDESKIMELVTSNNAIIGNIKQLIALSKEVEKAIDNIDDVQKRVLKEVAEAKVWGGGKLGNRELAPGQVIKEK